MLFRPVPLFLGLCLGYFLLSCGSTSSSSSTFLPTPEPMMDPNLGPVAVYVALGASDAVGFNASVSCDAAANAAGDRPRRADPPDCPNGTGYVPQIAAAIEAEELINLAISGSVAGPRIRDLGLTSPPATILLDQLPRLTGDPTLVTLFTGGNDTNRVAFATAVAVLQGQSPRSFIAEQVAAFGADINDVLAGIRQQAPNARLVMANLPNFGLTPLGQNQPASVQTLLTEISLGFNESVLNPLASQGIPVVDLLCDPRSYAEDSFFPGPFADGFHPNDMGYERLAELFVQAIEDPIPAPNLGCTFGDPSRARGGSLDDLDLDELQSFVDQLDP